MPKCFKCRKYVTKDSGISCKGSCDKFYHIKCATEGKLLSEVGICVLCAKADGTPKLKQSYDAKLNIDLPNLSAADLLAKVNDKLEILFDVKKTLEELIESVEYYQEKYDELKEEQEKSIKRIITLENKNVFLDKQNRVMEERIAFLEAKSRERNIEIAGLKSRVGEDIKKTVEIVGRKMGFSPDIILGAMRVGSEKVGKENKERPRPVIVTLTSVSARTEWLAQKKKRLTNSDIYGDNDSMPIFFNEDLTKFMRELLWHTKNELKSTYKYIWIQHGKVLVRKDEKDENKKIFVIRSVDDVRKLKEKKG